MSEETAAVAVVDPEAVEIPTADPTPAAAPKPVVPTGQQTQLGWGELDIRTKNFVTRRQVGTPSVEIKEVPKSVKVKVKKADPNDPTKEVEVEEVQQKVEKIKVVTYTWADEYETYGQQYAAPTPALRAQATAAKAHRNEGFTVAENLKKEYGVWYVTDPEGQRNGFRYSISYVDAPPKPVVEKKVRAPKAEKPKTEGTKRGKKADAVAAAQAATAPAAETINMDDMVGGE